MDRRSEGASESLTDSGTMSAGEQASCIYLMMVSGIVGAIVGVTLLYFGVQSGDHFAAITRTGNTAWYQNLAGNYVTEIQDEDLFFHNIGRSIDYARRAD